MKAKLFLNSGKALKEISIPKEFILSIKKDLLSQAIRVYENKIHLNPSKVKTRSEVVRTKKKWYKQKGTGGARHGAKSAPIFVGGGAAHGPKGVKRVLKMPVKMRKVALKMSLSDVFSRQNAILVEGFSKVTKTSQAFKIINSLRKTLKLKDTKKVLVVLSKNNYMSGRFYKNIKNVEISLFDNLNPFIVLKSGFVFMDSEVFIKPVKKAGKAKPKKS